MSEINKQWYVVRAIGGKEAKVKEYIEAEVRHNHLEDYISQVLIPTEKVYTIRNGKKVSKEKVSYPGYVLVEAAFVGQIPMIIRNTPNVLGFLGDTKEDSRKMNATPLRPQEVARILGRVDEMNAMEEENEIPFFVGETVKVTDGPFSSFQGTIEAVDNERKKLTVSVKIFGRKTPMELGFRQKRLLHLLNCRSKVVPPILRPRLVPHWVLRESISWTSASSSMHVRRTRREKFFRSSLRFTATSRLTSLSNSRP